MVDLRTFVGKQATPSRGFGRARWKLAYRRLHELAATTWLFQRAWDLTPEQVVFDGEHWKIVRPLKRAARFKEANDPDVFSSGALSRCLPLSVRESLRDAVVSERRTRRPEGWDRGSFRHVFCRVTRRRPAHFHVNWMLTSELPQRVQAELREVLPGLTGPRRFGDVMPFLHALKQQIKLSGSTVTLRLGGKSVRILTTALGKGNAGLVYATTDGRRVVKLPRASWWAIESLLDEAPSERFWAGVARRGGFTVPRTAFASDAGLYAVRQRLRDESLGDFLMRRGLFVYNRKTGQFEPARSVETLAADPDMRVIWSGVNAMIHGMRKAPQFALSLAPSNVYVQYGRDGKRRRVTRVGLVDVGPVPKAIDSYGAMDSPMTYLDYCGGRLTKYSRRGWVATSSPG